MAVETRILKQGPLRSVRLECRGETRVVVKRFEHSGPLGRAFDRARARREFALLQHLAKAGLAVPRPLALVRRGRGHEVELEWIEGARSLAELSCSTERLSLELARALGRLLAGLHSCGVDHPDLHPGNVLVTAEGRAIAVDFDKARLAGTLGAAQLLRDLVSLCAGLRETTRPGWRASAFEAWWTSLERGLRESCPKPDVLELEALARLRRRRVVEQRARRWTRAGSAVVALEKSRGFARVGVDSSRIDRALRGEDPPESLICVEGSRRRVLGLWRSMARLEEHRIVAPRCTILVDSRISRAWFERGSARAAATPAARGRIVGQLLDRGLWCAGLEPGDIDGTGLIRPRELTRSSTALARAELASWLAGMDQDARSQFLDALRAARSAPAGECAALVS